MNLEVEQKQLQKRKKKEGGRHQQKQGVKKHANAKRRNPSS